VKLAVGLLFLAGAGALLCAVPREQVLGSYSTSLSARSPGQRANARRAARALDGVTLPPGGEFSFNRTVGPWTADRGYVLAPVSYEGELVVDWGGGVCQTSTTLYNAALLAGLVIVERERHSWAPRYVPPGLDAAVAVSSADLRLRNPYPWPVRLHAQLQGERLGLEIRGGLAGPVAAVHGDLQEAPAPEEVVETAARLSAGHPPAVRGRPGVRVSIYRTYLTGPHRGWRELVSQDSYPPINRVVWTAAGD
jgi:vancomycin resistance protein YoaR